MKKIIVFGSENNKHYTPEQIEKCETLGRYLASIGAQVMTGGCKGYPYYVGRAAVKHGARVLGYTPALNLEEHIGHYNMPTDGVTELVFATKNFPTKSENYLMRSVDMTSLSDTVIVMGGSWGSFSELVMSFMMKKTMILIEEFEGAVQAFINAHEFFGARDVNPAVHFGTKIIRAKTVDEVIQKMSELVT